MANKKVFTNESLATFVQEIKSYTDNTIDKNKTIVDSALSDTSTNPVQNDVITAEFDAIKEAKADWNQNDETSIDYIKNRPFYTTDPVEIELANGTFTFNDMMGDGSIYMSVLNESCPELVVGNDIKVIFDGTEYNLVVKMTELGIYAGNGSIVNAFAGTSLENTGEPFMLMYQGGALGIFTTATGTEHSVTVAYYNADIIKIEEKYLPDSIFNSIDTIESNIDTIESNIDGKLNGKMDKANPTGTGSFSMNRKADTTVGEYSHAEGYNTTASGIYSHAEGHSTAATLTDDDVLTTTDSSKGRYTHAEGYGTVSYGSCSHAEGNGAKASGFVSHAEGYQTTASGNWGSHAEGRDTTASGNSSHAEGYSTTASGMASHAEGGSTTASGSCSHAEGQGTTASKQGSHAEGNGTTASGIYSHAEGNGTTALGSNSHAEGFSSNKLPSTITSSSTNDEIVNEWSTTKFSLAEGDNSHAEGKDTLALGDSSHAEGDGTIALSSGSHAEGWYTKASGTCSHAEGESTTASKQGSHAEGYHTKALSQYSHAEGYYTIASGENQHVQGKYNIEDTANKYAHIVGNGNGNSNSARANAHTLDWSGNAWFANDVVIGGTSQDTATIKLSDLAKPKTEIVMVDDINGYNYILKMQNGQLISFCACTSIEITTLPTKTEYVSGELFNPTGMIVTAVCPDGTSREVINYTYTTDAITAAGDITISYIENNTTYTATVSVTVAATE